MSLPESKSSSAIAAPNTPKLGSTSGLPVTASLAKPFGVRRLSLRYWLPFRSECVRLPSELPTIAW